VLWRLRLLRAAPEDCALVGRVSLHRGFGGSGGVVVVAGLLIEGLRVVDCRRAGGRKCVAMSSGRLAAV
jgi:hypothetical protein